VNGLVFGENPRAGYFRGAEFVHPDLRFRFRFPDGWTTQNQRQAVVGVSANRDATIQLTLAAQPNAAEAARAFLSQTGVTGGTPSGGVIPFSAVTENGEVRGAVRFAEHGGSVVRILALAPAASWPAQAATAERSLRSFAVLTEPAVLAVQPWRVAVVTTDAATTIEDLARRRPAPVPVATLSLINQLEPGARVAAGTRLKWVVGQPGR
jgi:predicted Zn-dependent protease